MDWSLTGVITECCEQKGNCCHPAPLTYSDPFCVLLDFLASFGIIFVEREEMFELTLNLTGI